MDQELHLTEQEIVRRNKMEDLRAKGIDPFGQKFERTATSGSLKKEFLDKTKEELLDRYKNKVYISLMSQYTPIKNLPYEELNRRLSKTEYNRVVDYAIDLGLVNGFIQDGESAKESFIPNFDCTFV